MLVGILKQNEIVLEKKENVQKNTTESVSPRFTPAPKT